MAWDIPFNKTFNPLRPEELQEVSDILQYRGVNGRYTDKLERTFEEMFGVKYAIACANATSGIDLAIDYFVRDKFPLIAAPTFTWWSTWKMSKYLNFIPCDVDKESWILHDVPNNVDLIISVDTFGNKSKIKTEVPVIYDAAHGFGLSELGHRGIVEVVSFSFTKIVQGIQGGMILTNDDDIATTLKVLTRIYAKMNEIEAYMCLKSLSDFPQNQTERYKIIQYYRENIKVPFREQLIPYETNYSVFAILFQTTGIRQQIVQKFVENSIEPKYYYTPTVSGCPISDDIYSRILALPVYHDVDKEKVCNIINSIL